MSIIYMDMAEKVKWPNLYLCNLAHDIQTARLRQENILPTSSYEMEESTGRVPEEVREHETQKAQPAAEPSSSGNVREEAVE